MLAGGSPPRRLEDESSRLMEFELPEEPEEKFRPQEPSKKLIEVGHTLVSSN